MICPAYRGRAAVPMILTALDDALEEIKTAAYAIRILAESINNQPESLLRGRR